jgi:N-acetylglucosaminyldiphosphoundecaprenol N-acetyl-beta-D-mannosaminyltransferase
MFQSPKKVITMGYQLFSSTLDEIILNNSQPTLINTISPNSYGISTKDIQFREALKNSDYLVLDGVYFALSSLILQGKNIKKNQGPEVFYHFMKRVNKDHGKVFFLGAAPQTLEKIKARASGEFPNLNIDTYSPPFKDEFTNEENNKMIDAINLFSPDILFVGMTCPKQEKWAYQNKSKLNTKLICCIGAVFDWYAGNQKEIHPLWWKLRLAWLKRTIDRPEILKRYPNIGIFFLHLFYAIIGIKKYKYGRF